MILYQTKTDVVREIYGMQLQLHQSLMVLVITQFLSELSIHYGISKGVYYQRVFNRKSDYLPCAKEEQGMLLPHLLL